MIIIKNISKIHEKLLQQTELKNEQKKKNKDGRNCTLSHSSFW